MTPVHFLGVRRIDWREFCALGYSLYEEVSSLQNRILGQRIIQRETGS
jgi:hypothetical protein